MADSSDIIDNAACTIISDRLNKFITDTQFQKDVNDDPSVLVANLSYRDAELVLSLIKYNGYIFKGRGGGSTSSDFGPFPGGMPW